MKLSEEKIAGFRNFTNKLWNMSRFMLLNIPDPKKDIVKPEAKTLSDKWILSRLDQVIFDTNRDLEKYNLSSAGERLRDFTWGDLADWYLEIAKIEGEKSDILNYLLNSILKLWHPFMPYVTETLWKEVYGEENILMVEKYPLEEKARDDGKQMNTFATLQNIVTQIRALRTEYKIEPAKKIKANFVTDNANVIEENKAIFLRLANLEDLQVNAEKTEGAISFGESGIEIQLDFSSAVDTEKERARLEKEIALVAPYVNSLTAKLAGDFARNAPEAVVEKERAKLSEATEKLQKLREQLLSLNS
jgi:valyl-tRNA synthetase